MAIAQRLIFVIFCVFFSYGQRIPIALFEPVVITSEQQSRIIALDSIDVKTLAEQEELALLYANTRAYEQSFDIFVSLAKDYPTNYDYQSLSNCHNLSFNAVIPCCETEENMTQGI